jgi:dTMP kinase
MGGKLVVFEGIEGVGKTTQIPMTQEWLLKSPWLYQLKEAGICSEVITTREPGGTELGTALRKLLLEYSSPEPLQDRAELLLYMADRTQHVENYLRPRLERGALILCDRYTDSTVAYQGYGRGLDVNLIHQLNWIATGGILSDLTLWLDADVERGLERMQARSTPDRMEESTTEFYQRVRQGFQDLTYSQPHRITRIDANGSEADVQAQIQRLLARFLQQWYFAELQHRGNPSL